MVEFGFGLCMVALGAMCIGLAVCALVAVALLIRSVFKEGL